MLDKYSALLELSLKSPHLTFWGILGIFGLSLLLFPLIGTAYFPRTDAGQFVINVKAPSGMRVEKTEELIARVEKVVREEVSPEDLDLVVSNIGLTPDFSAIYTSNSGPHTAFVQANLKEDHKVGSYEYMERVRRRLKKEVPEVTTYFQSGGLVDAVLNLGLPAPLDIQVSGSNMRDAHKLAVEIGRQVRAIKGVSDVLIPQDIDYPALKLEIDRVHASELGLSEQEIMGNVITALTSDGMIAPSFWMDPRTGNDYYLTVQYPEKQVVKLADLMAIPLRASNQAKPTRLDAVCKITRIDSPTEADHYQIRRVIDVYVAPTHEAIGDIYKSVQQIINKLHKPENLVVTVRGSVEGMNASFKSFGFGLILSVVLVYLILVAQFKSFIDPFLIILAVPTALTGVLIVLPLTNTTLNIMSLMGIVMIVGIAVSNSILIVEFGNRLRENGLSVKDAISTSCRVRLRPVMMTSFATLIGLLPMALALGAGSEAYAPLARAILGGLTVSLLLVVFIVPAGYLIIYRNSESLTEIPPSENRTEAAA